MSMQLTQEGIVQSSTTVKRGEGDNMRATLRLGGYTAIGGALTMFIGAFLWGASGADLWAALDTGDMASYLVAVGANKVPLLANLTAWIIGVLIIGIAGTILTGLCQQRRTLAQAAMVCFWTSVPLAIISFIAMLAIVVQIAPDTSATSVAIAQVVGWIGARADDLATALIVGVGPFMIARAGRGEWLPTWLERWGYLAGIVGVLSVVILYIPVAGLSPFALLIIPVGLFWLIAAGVVMLRRIESIHHELGQ